MALIPQLTTIEASTSSITTSATTSTTTTSTIAITTRDSVDRAAMSEGEPSPKRQHTSPAWDSLLRGPAVSPLRLSSAPHLGSTPSETVAYDAEADAARIDAAKAHNATASDLLSLLLRIEPARALLAVELLCLRDLCRLGATCSISRKITAKCLAPGGVRGLAVTRADAAAGVQLPVLRRLIRLAPPGSAIELPACVFDLGKGKALGVKVTTMLALLLLLLLLLLLALLLVLTLSPPP